MPPFLDNDAVHALEFFDEWGRFTEEALGWLLLGKCPSTPGNKVRPWKVPGGPTGIIYHYTGGFDGLASVRWANQSSANRVSSWHCTVLDSRIAKLDGVLSRYPLVSKYLPVTAFLHANIHKGTWHGNWTNSRTFGLENRNVGRLVEVDGLYGVHRRRKFIPLKDQKRAVEIRGQMWESYTREQLIANINIGKMLRMWRGCDFDPSWTLPHSAIKWTKHDTGSAFPIQTVRASVFSPVGVEGLHWLDAYTASATTPFLVSRNEDIQVTEARDEEDGAFTRAYKPLTAQAFDAQAGRDWRSQLPKVRKNLDALGYHIEFDTPEEELDPALRWAVYIFQMSTKYTTPKLVVDGVPGEKTRIALERRLTQFGFEL